MPRYDRYHFDHRPPVYWRSKEDLLANGTELVYGVWALEIARVRLTIGVNRELPIYAIRDENKIRYQVGDGDPRLNANLPPPSKVPLSFGELLGLIEDCIHPGDLRIFNAWGRPRDDMLGFASASSDFYPRISDWFDEVDADYQRSRKVALWCGRVATVVVALAVLVSVLSSVSLRVDFSDWLLLAWFSLPVLSLIWSHHRRLGLVPTSNLALIGCSAFLVTRGLSTAECALLTIILCSIYLLAGAVLDIFHQNYRQRALYRFSGIGFPNRRASKAALIVYSTIYLFHADSIDVPMALFVLLVCLVLLTLTRSRNGVWFTSLTLAVLTGLELWYGFPLYAGVSLGVLVLLAVVAAFLLKTTPVSATFVQQPDSLAKTTFHIGRDEVRLLGLGGRTVLWRYVIDAIRQRPLAGHGYGFWSREVLDDHFQKIGWRTTHSHSIYLETLLLCGIPGLLLLTTLIGYALFSVPAAGPPQSILLAAIAVYFGVHGLVESMFIMPGVLCFCLGMLMFSLL